MLISAGTPPRGRGAAAPARSDVAASSSRPTFRTRPPVAREAIGGRDWPRAVSHPRPMVSGPSQPCSRFTSRSRIQRKRSATLPTRRQGPDITRTSPSRRFVRGERRPRGALTCPRRMRPGRSDAVSRSLSTGTIVARLHRKPCAVPVTGGERWPSSRAHSTFPGDRGACSGSRGAQTESSTHPPGLTPTRPYWWEPPRSDGGVRELQRRTSSAASSRQGHL